MSDNGSASRRAGAAVSAVYIVTQIIVNLAYIPILLGTIGQTEYGLYQLVGSIIAYVTSISGVLSAGIGRFYSMYKAEGNEEGMASSICTARKLFRYISVAAILVIVLFIPIMCGAYKDSLEPDQLFECSCMLGLLAINLVVTLYNTISLAVLQANERFVFMKGSQLVTLLLQPCLILLLSHYYPYAISIVAVMLGMNFLCAFTQKQYCARVLNVGYVIGCYDKKLAKKIMGFSIAIILVTVADQIFWNADKIIIAFFYGADLVAVYAIGSQIYSAYLYTGQVVSSVFFQRVSELYHKDHDMEGISRLFAKVGRLTSMLCFLVLGGFIIFGLDFIRLWAGDGYEQSYWVAVAVMVPFTIDLIQNLGLIILQVVDKYMFRGVMYIFISLLNIIATIILVQTVGIVGAALSTGVSMIIGNGIIMNIYYKREIGLDISLFWREVSKLFVPVFCLVVLFVGCRLLFGFSLNSWSSIICAGLVYVVVYAFVVFGIAANGDERELFSSMLTKLLRK